MSEWQTFHELLVEESRLLAKLSTATLAMTEALVANEPGAIERTERVVESRRVLHGTAYAQRKAMQKRGFGVLTLPNVCAYAPTALQRTMYAATHQITTTSIAHPALRGRSPTSPRRPDRRFDRLRDLEGTRHPR